MKKYILALGLFCAFCALVFAQGLSPAVASVSVDAQGEKESVLGSIQLLADPQLAMSVPDYPVTAGDVYTLVFAAGATPVNYTIPVDSTYRIRIANLGVLNCKGLTYNQLKSQVDSLVSKNYPMGGVQFVLTAPAVFLVSITGEVRAATERKAWALTRLSSFVTDSLTSYSSLRNVSVVSADGKTSSYDLYKAQRDGDFAQDPYLRPGDKIIINRYDRRVSIFGAVERPGTYEILKGENLKSLIQTYGNGLTEYADTGRIMLNRINNSTDVAGDTVYLEKDVVTKDFTLENADTITISSRIDLRDTIFFEGAVGALGRESQNNTADTPDTNSINNPVINRIAVQFFAGENYATLVRRNNDNFFPTSDLRNAYIVRAGQKIPLNLENVLYSKDYMTDYVAQQNDTLYVPYMQNTSTVFIIGEVQETKEVEAWPLKRLSALVQENLTDYSSLRTIVVTAIDGTETSYDLFLASRFGDMSQNPYIRPGETITVKRIDRRVTIDGAVERPGTYELLSGENLSELITYYGGGLAPLADISRIELYRQVTGEEGAGKKSYLNKANVEANYALICYDSVYVSSYSDLMPVVFIEGAIRDAGDAGTVLETSNRIATKFTDGEDYAFFVRRNQDLFGAVSDVANAYILRNEERIPLDLTPMLYDATYYANVPMQANDVLMIPFRQFFVTVSGAVKNPGRFPYIPDRSYDYYVGLAGGFDPTRNRFDKVTITDVDGKKHSKKNFVEPEFTIEASTNAPLYYFNQYAPVITTILSILATSLSAYAVVRSMN